MKKEGERTLLLSVLLLPVLLLLVLLLIVPRTRQLREQTLVGVRVCYGTNRRLTVRRSSAVVTRRLTLPLLLLVRRVLPRVLLVVVRLLLLGRRGSVVLLARRTASERVERSVVRRTRILPDGGRVRSASVDVVGDARGRVVLGDPAFRERTSVFRVDGRGVGKGGV